MALLVLFVAAIVLPLVAGAGLFGAIVFLALFVLVALLVLLLALIARAWRPCRFRIINFLRGLILVVIFCVMGVVALLGGAAAFSFTRDSGELPLPDRYVAVIVADGANLYQARDLLMRGIDDDTKYATTISESLPNISRYFINQGAYTANGISVWPSSSVPAHTGIMTGCYPRKTGVMGQRQFRPSGPRHISYIGLGILELGRQLSRQVKTLCEYCPDVRSLVVLQIAHRGASLYIPTPISDELVVDRASDVIEATDFLGKYTGRSEVPRLVVMTLPDIDHQTHNALLNDARSVAIYLQVDELVGRLIELYKQKGIYDKTLFVLCADHGMDEVHDHLTIDNLMHDLRFQVFQSLKWTAVPAWGSFEANFHVARRDKFANVYDAVSLWGGNSDALVYVRGQQRDSEANVTSTGWDTRPTDETLRDYSVGGTNVDVIRRLIDYSPGIGLVCTNPEHHLFNVYSKLGQGQISEREQGAITQFRYTVVEGRDPLGYARNPAIEPYIRTGAWLSDAQWVELTYLEHYPDGLRRLACSFENPNSGDMHIVATDGWDFAPYYVAKHVLSGSHGSLNLHASLVPIMFHGPGVRHVEMPYGRTVDILPTVLEYFGIPSDSVDGRALPIFADDAKSDAIMRQAGNTFAPKRLEDALYAYELEHVYASYDRRLVRINKATSEREILVGSVRQALPELREQANITLEPVTLEGGKLTFRKLYPGQALVGGTVRFDTATQRFE